MAALTDRTIFITGASRGIGRAIALRAAADGARVVIAAKTSRPHRVLSGTIHTVAEEVQAAGGEALAVQMDARSEEAVEAAVAEAVGAFGGIDILVNNCSAISLTGTLETPMRRYDLMMGVNVRATYACTQACLPYLFASENPHVLTLSPPPELKPGWFKDHVAYTISKYGMSLCTLGMAEEFRERGVAFNSLWPRTVIATEALKMIPGVDARQGRKPQIVADAAHAILARDARACTGNFFIDDEVLAQEGVTDLSGYLVDPDSELLPDLFVECERGRQAQG